MRKIINASFIFVILLSQNVKTLKAQSYFIKSLEKNASTDKLFGNIILSNGDIVLSGHTNSDILLIRSDSLGNIIWQKTYPGTPDSEEGKVCVITSSGNIAVSGYSKPNTGTFDAMIVNTDANGNLQWIKKYGHPSYHTKAWPVDTIQGDNLYLAGWTSDLPNNGNWTSGFVLRTNALGDTIWTRRFGSETIGNQTYFRTLASTNDGGCIAVGESNQYGAGGYDVIAVKLNSNGDTLWTKTYGDSGDDYGWSVKQTSDGGYIICGNTGSFGYTTFKSDMLIIRLDSNGNIIWTKTIGDASNTTTLDAARSVIETSDNNFVLCGYTGPSDEDGILMKLNSLNGDTLWSKQYFLGAGKTHFRYLNEINPGNYLISGYSNSIGTGSDDILFLKIKENGFAGGCYETSISPTYQVNNQTLLTGSGIPAYQTGFTVSAMSNSGIPTFTENMLCDSTITTGIGELEEIQFILYPNPTNEKITISPISALSYGEINVFNILGMAQKNMIYSKVDNHLVVDFSNLSSGIYFVSFTLQSGLHKTVKVLKE